MAQSIQVALSPQAPDDFRAHAATAAAAAQAPKIISPDGSFIDPPDYIFNVFFNERQAEFECKIGVKNELKSPNFMRHE
jgi:hypothetical protein